MKIVVSVKLAAALDEGATLRDGAVDPTDLEWDVNEWDLYAVETAVQLKEAAGDGEVVLVSVGGEQVSEGLLTCLAMGADRAIHVEVDDEAEALDSIAVARLLAAVIGPESPDIVLSGVQSSDFASAATGTALAGVLGLAHVAVVRAVRLDDRVLEVDRELEGGLGRWPNRRRAARPRCSGAARRRSPTRSPRCSGRRSRERRPRHRRGSPR